MENELELLRDEREAICGALGLHPDTSLDCVLETIVTIRHEARRSADVDSAGATLRIENVMLRRAGASLAKFVEGAPCTSQCKHQRCALVRRWFDALIQPRTLAMIQRENRNEQIVANLPITRDGVPVAPGGVVYLPDGDGGATRLVADNYIIARSCRHGKDDRDVAMCYSTPEAAIAATKTN